MIQGILLSTFLIAGLHFHAEARVPLGQLEKLRQQTIVVRVVMDDPESTEAKTCQFKDDFAQLGATLALNMDNAAETFKSIQVTEADIPLLKAKTKICAARGSCQVYERFLENAQVASSVNEQISEIKKDLELTLSKIEAANYRKAWRTLPRPCEVF